MRYGVSIIERLCLLRPRTQHSWIATAASAEQVLTSESRGNEDARFNYAWLSEVGREFMLGLHGTQQSMQRHAAALPAARSFSTSAPAAGSSSQLSQVEANLGDRSITLECGELALLADGACVARQGSTSVLVTVVGGTEVEEGGDFLPLQVDFREPTAASGHIPRTPSRRERGNGTEREVLTSRALDRALRPLFPPGYFFPVHLVATVLSDGGDADTEVLALNAASAALMLSDIPWGGPVGAVRITRSNGELVANGSTSTRNTSKSSGSNQTGSVSRASAPGLTGASNPDVTGAVMCPEMDLLVACCERGVVMVEMGGREVPEDVVAEALARAQHEVAVVMGAQVQLAAAAGRRKRAGPLAGPTPEQLAAVEAVVLPLVESTLSAGGRMGKAARSAAIERAKAAGWAALSQQWAAADVDAEGSGSDAEVRVAAAEVVSDDAEGVRMKKPTYLIAFDSVLSGAMRRGILEDGLRPDGRGLNELRDITARPGYLPHASAVHGSALFGRGETQALCTATVGVEAEAAAVWTPAGTEVQRLMLHYTFPPFATNEVGTIREPGRREVGHGALALRALLPAMPPAGSELLNTAAQGSASSSASSTAASGLPPSTVPVGAAETPPASLPAVREWPFVVRLHSQTLASNGSSSMAAVCGGALALEVAGVPTTCRVAGISIGLVYDDACMPAGGSSMAAQPGTPSWDWPATSDRYALLTDIAGLEDALGDMDFKVAGSASGVTALQLDVKQPGLPVQLLVEALGEARTARLQLLDIMAAALDGHAAGLAARGGMGPRTEVLAMSPDNVPLLVGERGAGLAALQATTGARIMASDTGLLHVYAPTPEALASARGAVAAVEGTDMREGDVFVARVAQVHDWGALLDMPNGTRHVLHVSEVAHGKVRDVGEVVREGDEVRVVCLGRDLRGLVRLSRKALLPPPSGARAAPAAAGLKQGEKQDK